MSIEDLHDEGMSACSYFCLPMKANTAHADVEMLVYPDIDGTDEDGI